MRIAITTLGCKINQYDSAVIQDRLEGKHLFVPFGDEADCYVINTCTVTDRADWEARQLVRRAKRTNPAARVLVTGCYAQVNPDEVAQVSGVDYVVGLNRLDDLLRFVEAPAQDSTQVAVSDVKRERGVPVLGTRALPGHTRAFLKIQEGCNYTCTYCIIPTARGLSRSVTPRAVLEQVRRLADAGYKEIVLTGIHLGGYGQDLNPKIDLTAVGRDDRGQRAHSEAASEFPRPTRSTGSFIGCHGRFRNHLPAPAHLRPSRRRWDPQTNAPELRYGLLRRSPSARARAPAGRGAGQRYHRRFPGRDRRAVRRLVGVFRDRAADLFSRFSILITARHRRGIVAGQGSRCREKNALAAHA